GMLYLDVILAYLDPTVLAKILEDEVDPNYQPFSDYLKRQRAQGLSEGHAQGLSEGLSEGHAQGLSEGMLEMLERLLDRRGLQISAEQRERMRTCRDPARLQRWFDRAIMATHALEIFDA
ncbi:MAG: hypothetical protein KDK70_24985, partial [Myxococcales bacterium]|nr:hypothetical protein [Myxococcales bacterium]